MSTSAKTSFRSGDIDTAFRDLESAERLTVELVELRATIDYLCGRYGQAIEGFRQVMRESTLHPFRLRRARQRLALAYFQTNRFEDAGRLPLRDPLTRLMRAFTNDPYITTWTDEQPVALPFLQKERWELPQVAVTVNGEDMVAKIDTGGDLFSVPWSTAERIGVRMVSTSVGWYAGGRRTRVGRGILDRLELRTVRVDNVPVSINNLDHPVVGTGLLRQFHPILDYPEAKLVLQPRGGHSYSTGFPFLLASTHLLIAEGGVNGIPARLLVDSGLEATNDGGFLAPETTLVAAGIPIPEPAAVEGSSGAGKGRLDIGEFYVDELQLGTETRHGVTGLTGVFPPQLTKDSTVGFPIDGLVSHNFLRHFRWSINFDDMRMALTCP